jgi:ABC-type branched-subunit amino acid transport system ATPase component
MPELLGVVQVPGRGGTAIFNTTTGSVTAAIGENIGSSGWHLQSVANDQAQIIRQGIVRVLSLSSR